MTDALQPIDPWGITFSDQIDDEELYKRVTLFIYELLQHEFEKLCSLMYRHDVNERLFDQALMLENDEERAKAIARLVIEREMQKAKTRKMYSDFKNRNKLKGKSST
jgi:hypothetical protein